MTNILIVDDSASIRQMVEYTLKGAGYDVVAASDGQEGLSAATNGQFDVIVSDVNMPNMDGLTMVKSIRGLDNYKFTPILMLTTESSSEKKAEGKAAGATGWIVKPFNPDTLLGTLKKVI